MNWLDEVQRRINRKNQVLFAKNSAFLADLAALIQEQNLDTLWAFEFANETVQKLSERYPNEQRLEFTVLTSKDWVVG